MKQTLNTHEKLLLILNLLFGYSLIYKFWQNRLPCWGYIIFFIVFSITAFLAFKKYIQYFQNFKLTISKMLFSLFIVLFVIFVSQFISMWLLTLIDPQFKQHWLSQGMPSGLFVFEGIVGGIISGIMGVVLFWPYLILIAISDFFAVTWIFHKKQLKN